jgi:hypothetical protein
MTTTKGRYDFQPVTRGDTFNGTNFTILVNDVALDLTDALIEMDLKLTPDATTSAKTFTSDNNGGITIDADPTTGKFTVDAGIMDETIAVGNYYYDIEITLSNNVVKTYVGGRWNILQDVTNAS